MKLSRIAIPVLGFVPAGGTRVLCCLATEFVRIGLDVDFLVLDDDTRPPFPTEARVIYARAIDPSCVPARGGGKLGIVRNILRLARAVRQVRGEYDLWFASFAFVALACALGGVRTRTLYYVQGYDPEVLVKKRKLASWIGAALAYLSYWACRHQVVNSPHYFGYPGISATTFIPPGVDTAIFHAKRGGLNLEGRSIRIGIVGRSEPHKYRPVLEAFAAIAAAHPGCVLVVAFGNIPETALAAAGNHDVVLPRNDSELADFYRGCDVLLALSELPVGAFYPPLEALACGTLLISNRFLFIDSSNAWVVDRADQVVAAFDAILRSSVLERAAKQAQGIRTIRDELRWPDLARRFIEYAERSLFAPQAMPGSKA